VNGTSTQAVPGKYSISTIEKATACSVCPEGKLNWSSARTQARMSWQAT